MPFRSERFQLRPIVSRSSLGKDKEHGDRRNCFSQMIESRVDSLFAGEINLRVSQEKFDSHAKPHARTSRSGRCTVALAATSWHELSNSIPSYRQPFEMDVSTRANSFVGEQVQWQVGISVVGAIKSVHRVPLECHEFNHSGARCILSPQSLSRF